MKKGKRGVIRLELLTAILCLISQLIGLKNICKLKVKKMTNFKNEFELKKGYSLV